MLHIPLQLPELEILQPACPHQSVFVNLQRLYQLHRTLLMWKHQFRQPQIFFCYKSNHILQLPAEVRKLLRQLLHYPHRQPLHEIPSPDLSEVPDIPDSLQYHQVRLR